VSVWAIGGVLDQAGLQRAGQQPLHGRLGRAGLARGGLDQHVPGMHGLQRLAQAGDVLEGEGHAQAAHQLEGLDRAAGLVLGLGQQGDGVVRRGDGGDGHAARGQQRIELEAGGGDDPQRALGPDQQVLEVVAGVVLAQALEAVPDLAAGQHRLDPQDLVAHDAVAQHGRAAGVGRGQAADRARALRGQAQREAAVDATGPPRGPWPG
jgi:hypothetical protein